MNSKKEGQPVPSNVEFLPRSPIQIALRTVQELRAGSIRFGQNSNFVQRCLDEIASRMDVYQHILGADPNTYYFGDPDRSEIFKYILFDPDGERKIEWHSSKSIEKSVIYPIVILGKNRVVASLLKEHLIFSKGKYVDSSFEEARKIVIKSDATIPQGTIQEFEKVIFN